MREREAAQLGGPLSAAIPVSWRLRAIAAAAIIPPLLEIVSFARLERVLRTAARLQTRSAPDDLTASKWVDEFLSRLRSPWNRTCLRRASILYYMLRSTGRTVSLCIGVRRDEKGELLAHAWLLRDGAVYVEPYSTSEIVSEYTLIAQFPATAPQKG
ncbi:MAG: lasso peptide biosynthesis B2 protein [bacterium]